MSKEYHLLQRRKERHAPGPMMSSGQAMRVLATGPKLRPSPVI
jgi:hypothetical protein